MVSSTKLKDCKKKEKITYITLLLESISSSYSVSMYLDFLHMHMNGKALSLLLKLMSLSTVSFSFLSIRLFSWSMRIMNLYNTKWNWTKHYIIREVKLITWQKAVVPWIMFLSGISFNKKSHPRVDEIKTSGSKSRGMVIMKPVRLKSSQVQVDA